eukprot:scaffold8134_cov138-Isochrysis_galbana.AAC.1
MSRKKERRECVYCVTPWVCALGSPPNTMYIVSGVRHGKTWGCPSQPRACPPPPGHVVQRTSPSTRQLAAASVLVGSSIIQNMALKPDGGCIQQLSWLALVKPTGGARTC